MAVRRTHYDVLGVDRDASSVDIASAFRDKFAALKAKPDIVPEAIESLRDAYQTLASPERRAEYDESLAPAMRPSKAASADDSGEGAGFWPSALRYAIPVFVAVLAIWGWKRHKAPAPGPVATVVSVTRSESPPDSSPGRSAMPQAARGGAQTYLGAGENVYELKVAPPDDTDKPPPLEGPIKLVPSAPLLAKDSHSVLLKPTLVAAALDEPVAPPKTPSGPRAPRIETSLASFRMPDGVTAVNASERGLLVGTRFLGSERIENGVVRLYRAGDLPASAARITVACQAADECYLATGGARAWRFDGQAFDPAAIDPEAGSRVLAVLRDPKGRVLAIHRGATDPTLRFSTVEEGRFIPVTIQDVAVPLGAPELNFAEFSPDGHLWVGLRYTDKDKDAVDYGAAEIELDSGRVVYHRQGALDGKTTYGFALPSDMVAMYWRSATEAWFATRSGAARLLDGKVRLFTENDGMESELIYDINAGPENEVWVATRHGTGRYDGKRWTFPKMGPFYLRAASLAHDAKGHVFVGTDKGMFCVAPDCDPEAIDQKRGLLEDNVLDLTVDSIGRVWVLTSKGISIVEP